MPAPAATPADTTPISVGLLDQERGANTFTENGAGARAARDYINSKLDGINGRQLEFVECSTDGSPEASINCANQFVRAKVVAVLMGIDLGSDAALPILTKAHIPFVAFLALGSAQSVSKDAFFFGAPSEAAVAAPMKLMAQRLHVKSVAFILQDNVVGRTALIPRGVAPAAKHLKLKLTTVFVDPANPDYTQAVTTALAAKPDALFMSSSETDCSRLIVVIRQLHFDGPVFSAGCSAFISEDPKDSEGVIAVGRLWVQSAAAGAPKDKAAEVKAFAAEMARSAPKYAADAGAQRTFAATMDIASVMRRIKGEISPTALLAQLRETRGVPGFMGSPLNCDGKQWPGQPTACSAAVLLFRAHAGALRAYSNGFVDAADVVSS
jgi:branched-chain amino acid transport system substrate-binding protein